MKRNNYGLVLTIVWFQLCSSAGATSQESIRANNDGVTALKEKKFEVAVQYFLKALKADPSYELAKENLATALNNAGIAAQANPVVAKTYFQQALYLAPNNATAAQNLNVVLEALGVPSKTFVDRLSNANTFLERKDELGAIVEYQQAVKLNSDPSVRDKLNKLLANANIPGLEGIKPLGVVALSGSTAIPNYKPGPYVINPYLRIVQNRIREIWKAPADMKDDAEVNCTFDVLENGRLSNIKITKSKNASSEIEGSVLSCLQNMGSLPELPAALKKIATTLPVGVTFKKQIGADRDCIMCGIDIDFGPYMAYIHGDIKKNWFPPRGSQDRRATVIFEVLESGAVRNVHMGKRSGDEDFDKAALAAMSKIAKVAPLPDGCPSKVDIEFTFDYNIHK